MRRRRDRANAVSPGHGRHRGHGRLHRCGWWSAWPAWNAELNQNGAFATNADGHFFPEFFDLELSETSSTGKTLADYQQALVDKTLAELGPYRNVHFEVMRGRATSKRLANERGRERRDDWPACCKASGKGGNRTPPAPPWSPSWNSQQRATRAP